jgi:hypothetical protein
MLGIWGRETSQPNGQRSRGIRNTGGEGKAGEEVKFRAGVSGDA